MKSTKTVRIKTIVRPDPQSFMNHSKTVRIKTGVKAPTWIHNHSKTVR